MTFKRLTILVLELLASATFAHAAESITVVETRRDLYAHLPVDRLDELFHRDRLDTRLAEGVVQVGDVRLVVFGMVDFHGTRIEVRFERIVGVG